MSGSLPNSLFKHAAKEATVAVLQTGTLRWSHPKKFNDEFEVPENILKNLDSREVFSSTKRLLLKLADDSSAPISSFRPDVVMILLAMRKMNSSQREELIRKAKADFNPARHAQTLDGFREHWRSVHPTTRVLSLTERFDSASMWDRYSEGRKGAVLEFRCASSPGSIFSQAMAVTYVVDPTYESDTAEGFSRISVLRSDIATNRIYKDYLFTKTDSWSNEREWRLIRWGKDSEHSEFTDLPFNSEDLQSITFGTASSQPFIDAVKEVAKSYPKARLMRAVSNASKRRIERIEIT